MFAYIDPGLGQLIWLSIVSAFTGLVFYIKKTRAFVARIFLNIFGRGKKVAGGADAKTSPAEKLKAGTNVR